MNGNGNFSVQARQAGGSGTGGPSMKPGGGDRRAVVVLTVLVATAVVALAFFG